MKFASNRFLSRPCWSQPVVSEVPVDELEALVPVEDHVALTHTPDSLNTEIHHVLEVPKDEVDRD